MTSSTCKILDYLNSIASPTSSADSPKPITTTNTMSGGQMRDISVERITGEGQPRTRYRQILDYLNSLASLTSLVDSQKTFTNMSSRRIHDIRVRRISGGSQPRTSLPHTPSRLYSIIKDKPYWKRPPEIERAKKREINFEADEEPIVADDIAKTELSKPLINYFPFDVLKWMKANAKPQMAVKLMQICKYFQHKKFPYFVVKDIKYCDDGIYYSSLNQWNEEIPDNLWITTAIYVNSPFIFPLISNICVCEARLLHFKNSQISIREFKSLTSHTGITLKRLILESTIIYGIDYQMLPFEHILKFIPAIEDIIVQTCVPSFLSLEAAKELFLPNLKIFNLTLIDETFDAEAFIEFMRKHKTTKFILTYRWYFEYIPHLQAYADESKAAGYMQHHRHTQYYDQHFVISCVANETLSQAISACKKISADTF